MAGIRERIETVFAALAFAEQDLDQEARDILNEKQDRAAAKTSATRRTDTRPRVRV